MGKEELTKDEVKAALKEAIKEWLDQQFIRFGKWSLAALASMALTLLLYASAKMSGWIK